MAKATINPNVADSDRGCKSRVEGEVGEQMKGYLKEYGRRKLWDGRERVNGMIKDGDEYAVVEDTLVNGIVTSRLVLLRMP